MSDWIELFSTVWCYSFGILCFLFDITYYVSATLYDMIEGAALAAGVFVAISYWWNQKHRNKQTNQQAELSKSSNQSTTDQVQNGKYTKSLHNGGLLFDSVSPELQYMQQVDILKTYLSSEIQHRKQLELQCQTCTSDLDTLKQKHATLQNKYDELLRQHDTNIVKLRCFESANMRLCSAVDAGQFPNDLLQYLYVDSEEAQEDTQHAVSGNNFLQRVADALVEDSSSSISEPYSDSDLDLASDENSDQDFSPGKDFELTENVMHCIIARDSLTNLLQYDLDDLTDLVGLNQPEEDDDLDELVSNNSQYSQEEDEGEEVEEPRRLSVKGNKDINIEHIKDVKSTRMIWENLIKDKDSQDSVLPCSRRHRSTSGSCSSCSNCSSPPGSAGSDQHLSRHTEEPLSSIPSHVLGERHDNNNKTVDGKLVDFSGLKKAWESYSQPCTDDEG